MNEAVIKLIRAEIEIDTRIISQYNDEISTIRGTESDILVSSWLKQDTDNVELLDALIEKLIDLDTKKRHAENSKRYFDGRLDFANAMLSVVEKETSNE